jgi:predicted amidophosphoribosyltransferase
MNYCVDCGSPIPDDQNTCSMCYEDVDHGHDGYYQEWLEEQQRENNNKHQDEEIQ